MIIQADHQQSRTALSVLGVPVTSLSMDQIVAAVNGWIDEGDRARLVTFTNVHMVVEAQLRPRFRRLLQSMDLNCPDGAPIFWLVRRKREHAEKIAGPDFMPMFCEQSVRRGHRHFFYGGALGVAQATADTLAQRFPGLLIGGHESPPFRELSPEETQAVIGKINASRADVVWVCLGCPQQERWISAHRDKLNAKVVLAVGQAFDIVAGRTSRAPALMRRCGMEWTFRLWKEPRRLWKRYLVTNSLFVLFLVRDKLERTFALEGTSMPHTFDQIPASTNAPLPPP